MKFNEVLDLFYQMKKLRRQSWKPGHHICLVHSPYKDLVSEECFFEDIDHIVEYPDVLNPFTMESWPSEDHPGSTTCTIWRPTRQDLVAWDWEELKDEV